MSEYDAKGGGRERVLKKFKVKFEEPPEMLTTWTDCPQQFLWLAGLATGPFGLFDYGSVYFY